MSVLSNTSPLVYQEFPASLRIETTLTTGTRKYLYTSNTLSGTKVLLPKLGDSWDNNYNYVYLKGIDMEIFNSCGDIRYTCHYDSSPWLQTSVALTKDELPISLDLGGSTELWEPEKENSYWQDSDPSNKEYISQPMPKRGCIGILKIQRIIKDIDAFNYTVVQQSKTINSGEFVGFPAGTVLFIGTQQQPFIARNGKKRWKVDLTFEIMMNSDIYVAPATPPTGAIGVGGGKYILGWNFILDKKTGRYRCPLRNSDGYKFFENGDFDTLFSSQDLGDIEDMYQLWPNK